MKEKKDGKSRTPYSGGCGLSLNNSPLASSTTEKDELNSSLALRSYHHHPAQHHTYYQTAPPPSSMSMAFSSNSTSNYSKPFQQQPPPTIDYNPSTATDMYEMSTNYCMKQSPTSPFNPSNYYNNGVSNALKANYIPPTSYERHPVSFDSYYFNSDASSVLHHQPSGPAAPPFA